MRMKGMKFSPDNLGNYNPICAMKCYKAYLQNEMLECVLTKLTPKNAVYFGSTCMACT